MRTTDGERRVDVIYRRVDDEFLDPVHFRADSLLGCPGLMNAARAGNVDARQRDRQRRRRRQARLHLRAGPHPLLPRRGADPRATCATWRLEEPDAREEVLDRLDELVVKPVDGSGGKGLVIGPQATREELDALRAAVLSRPARLDRAAGRAAVDRPTLVGTGCARATSTCGRSRSTTATRCGCCPAG